MATAKKKPAVKKAAKKVAKAPVKKVATKRAYKRKPKIDESTKVENEQIQVADKRHDDMVDAIPFDVLKALIEQNLEEERVREHEALLGQADVILLDQASPEYRLILLAWMIQKNLKTIGRGKLVPVTSEAFLSHMIHPETVAFILDTNHGVVTLVHKDDGIVANAKNAVTITQIKIQTDLDVAYVGTPAPAEIEANGAKYQKIEDIR